VKRYLLFFIILLLSSKLLAQPVISSFTPATGPIGTVVTINGTNFSNILTENIVFFGAVKATVSTATATSLTVTVPIGTTYDPITVTTLNNNLTAYSLQPFHVTFPGAGPTFTATSFDPHIDFDTYASNPGGLINNDLDDDGKPDFATANGSSSIISILKNTSTSGALSFLPHIDVPGTATGGMSDGDIDGDGKQDIVTPWGGPESILIYKNTSTASAISFAAPVSFPAGLLPISTNVGDIDGDGKPDVALVEGNSFTVSVFRNTTTAGVISFAPRVSFTTVTGANNVLIRDLDGDGKPDLSICVSGNNKLIIYRNISTPGTLAFDPRLEFAVQNIPYGIAIGDLDGDGKPEVAVNNNNSSTISIFRNLSSPSIMNFAPRVDITVGGFSQKIAIGDLDGDGKLDIAATRAAGLNQTIAVFKNTSSPGILSFQPKIEYVVASLPDHIAIGDFDSDGLPDIAANAISPRKITILRSAVACTSTTISSQPTDSIICAGANASFFVNALNAVSYQWQVDMGAGWVDLTNNATYSGVATNTLNITAASLAMNNYRYRCVVTNSCGFVNSASALLIVNTPSAPSINISATAVTICQGTSVTFTAVPVNGGSSPAFQWKKNNINVGTNSNTYSDNGLINGDIINCTVTSNGTCITTPTAISNNIAMIVNTQVTPSITITASSNNICQGTAITFTAIPVNGGSSPAFQWKKNNINVGSNSSTYIDNALINGDIIKCILTSSSACAIPNAANSNDVVMIVNPLVTPAITVTESANNICQGTSVTFTAVPVNGGSSPVFQWKKNNINVGGNSATYSDNGLANGDVISCVLTSNAACAPINTISSNNVTITVITAVTPSISINSSAISICAGTPVTFTAVPVNGGTTPIYQWKKNSVNVGINSNTYTDNGLINGDVVNCVLTSNGACITTPNATSNNINITVSAPVTATISISASANNICFGTAVTFTAAGINGGAAPAYQWKKNGINVGTNNFVYTDNTLNNGDIITCVLASSLGCLTSPTATSNQVVMTIIPAVTPTITVTPSANNICPGTLVTFNTTVTNGGLSPAYQWKKNGINVGANTPAYSDNTIANGDIVACVLTSNLVAGCLTNPVANSNNTTMTLQSLPGNVNLGPDKNGCTGSPVVLNAQPGFVSYLWQDASTNATFNATASGTYQLQATDVCGNISTDDIVVSFKPTPVDFLPSDTAVCSYKPIIINPANVYNKYLWSTNVSSPSITITTPGLYWLQVTDNNNCIGRDTINVFSKNCLIGFYVPNAFTPNGDTKNDEFKPSIFGTLKQYEFKVLNRYGEQIFYSKAISKGWDGKLKAKDQNLNVFVWICTYQLEGQMVNVEKGTVILMR